MEKIYSNIKCEKCFYGDSCMILNHNKCNSYVGSLNSTFDVEAEVVDQDLKYLMYNNILPT